MNGMSIFDLDHYLAINSARWEIAEAVIGKLSGLGVETVYDVGCGPGWFADKLLQLGLTVTGLEVRQELLHEARRRVPGAKFVEFNADASPTDGELPVADLVFCFGLLYHLENPFNAVRRLEALTRSVCLIESVMVADDRPTAQLVEESSNIDQGFTNHALIPSHTTLIKMLYVSGFKHVYEFTGQVAHRDFIETDSHFKRRRIFLAAYQSLSIGNLERLAEPGTPKYQYEKPPGQSAQTRASPVPGRQIRRGARKLQGGVHHVWQDIRRWLRRGYLSLDDGGADGGADGRLTFPMKAPANTLERVLSADPEGWTRAREAARGGPRVLLATNVTGIKHASLLESVLGIALTLRGAEVHYLVCDGVLPACQHAGLHNVPDPGIFARSGLPDEVCRNCLVTGSGLLGPLGLPVLRFSELIPARERKRSRAIARSLPFDDVKNYRINGLSVGEHAYAGALRYFARGDLEGVTNGEMVVRRYLEAALLSVSAVETALAQGDFAVACFHHGIYVPQGPTGEVCRRSGVPVVNWNASYRKNTFIFSHGDTYHHTMLDEDVSIWKSIPWSNAREQEILDYLDSRRHGGRDWIWFHEKPDEDFHTFAGEVGLDLDRPIIGLLTNVIWDGQLHYPANAFPSLIDWVLRTIAYFRDRPDLQLLIRIHPAEIRGTIPSHQPMLAEIRRHFEEIPDNVFIIEPECPVSTYAAMEVCDTVLIYGTKTGVELTAAGIPVVAAGEAWIRNKGLTRDAGSADEYFRFLDDLPAAHRLNPDTLRDARRYAYHFFFRRMIPLPFIVASSKAIYDLDLDSFDTLTPGCWPGLDIVCDGILEGKPFIYPAERLGIHDLSTAA